LREDENPVEDKASDSESGSNVGFGTQNKKGKQSFFG